MKFKRIKHILIRLSHEEKTILIGGLAVIIGAFLPWYSTTLNFNGNPMTENGFSGDLGVIGFTATLLIILSLLFVISKHFYLPLPQFGQQKNKIILFLTGQSAFLILLTMAIYTKRSLDFTNAEINFGLYTSLLGSCIAVFATFAQIQRESSKEARTLFEQGNEPIERIVAIKHEVKQPSPPSAKKIDQINLFDDSNKTLTVQKVEEKNQSRYFLREAGVEKLNKIEVKQ